MSYHRTKELLVTPPAVEPITVAEAQAHLRVDTQFDADYIQALIVSARKVLEEYCWSSFISQVWTYYFDRYWWKMMIPRCPVCTTSSLYTSINLYGNPTGIQYIGYIPPQGTPASYTALPNTIWETSQENQKTFIRQAYLATWPITRGYRDDVMVTVVTGYGDSPASVPLPIKQAIKLLVAHLYASRGEVPAKLPEAIDYLITPYRFVEM